MTDLEKMIKAISYNGYRHTINEMNSFIILDIVGFSNGRRLARFEFTKDGKFILE